MESKYTSARFSKLIFLILNLHILHYIGYFLRLSINIISFYNNEKEVNKYDLFSFSVLK